jgi:phospholipase C
MAETVPIVGTSTERAFLLEGETLLIEFRPEAGPGFIRARRTRSFGGALYVRNIDNGATDPFDPTDPEAELPGGGWPPAINLGGVRIELFEPGSPTPLHTMETQDYEVLGPDSTGPGPALDRLDFYVPSELARGLWRCRLTNITEENSVVSGHLQYVQRNAPLFTTRVPMRLLNRALGQFITALGFQVFAHKGVGLLLSVNEEIEHLTNGRIRDTEVAFPDIPVFEITSENFALTHHSVRAERDPSTPSQPRLTVEATFAGQIEFGRPGIIGIEVTRIDIAISLVLFSTAPEIDRLGNRIKFSPEVTVKIEGSDEGLPEGKDIPDIEDDIRSAVREFLRSPEVRRAIEEHLVSGFMQLVEREHFFWDISADSRNFIIRHVGNRRPSDIIQGAVDAVQEGEIAVATDTVNDTGGGETGGLGEVAEEPEVIERSAPERTTVLAAQRRPSQRRAADPTLDNLDKISHIIVLMMENRSFDHMLGYLRTQGNQEIDGLTGMETNPNRRTEGTPIRVSELRNSLFASSPHHDYENVLLQVNDGAMDGFVDNFLQRYDSLDPRLAMGYYTDEILDVYHEIAGRFTVCDRWFCSFPGATMPNRLIAVTGGTPILNNLSPSDPRVGYLRERTIFEFLNGKAVSWAYHEHDIAFLRLFNRYRLDDADVLPFGRVRGYRQDEAFVDRVKAGALPDVTFIDPDYVDVPPDRTANDDHPPADLRNGQQLVRRIYNALVESPVWDQCLFVITYDEHGGFYDHVPPPGTAAAPTAEPVPTIIDGGPTFYGVRVPAFVISPWAPASVSHTLFDHTSILSTIIHRFAGGDFQSFGDRVKHANHLGGLLTNDTPSQAPRIPSRPAGEAQFVRPPVRESSFPEYHDVVKLFGLPPG